MVRKEGKGQSYEVKSAHECEIRGGRKKGTGLMKKGINAYGVTN